MTGGANSAFFGGDNSSASTSATGLALLALSRSGFLTSGKVSSVTRFANAESAGNFSAAPEVAGPGFGSLSAFEAEDRKSTRLNSKSLAYLVCRLLLEKKKK